MRALAAVAWTGVDAVLLHPVRSATSLACLVAILLPYVAGAGVSRGLLDQAEASIEFGADLYLTATRFGLPAPVPLDVVPAVRAIAGVRDVVPRIVGEVALGEERLSATVVGIPADHVPAAARCIDGRLFRAGLSHELVVGAELARRLELSIGAVLPPFYRNDAGEKLSTVVGLFRAESPVWEANLLFCSFETAAAIFAQDGLATGLLVSCDPAYRDAVEARLAVLPAFARRDEHGARSAVVTSKDDLRALLPAGLRHLEGIFNLHFVLAFAVGIPLLLVASGLGLSERRREAGLLKATGWMTDELLVRGLAESLVLALLGAALAVVLAVVWLDLLGGRGIVGVFLPGVAVAPAFDVPFRLLPLPAALAFVISFAIVATGTLYSVWRVATVPPALALR